MDQYLLIHINTIFRGMNIHLPAILMFTRGTRFWPIASSPLLSSVLPTGSLRTGSTGSTDPTCSRDLALSVKSPRIFSWSRNVSENRAYCRPIGWFWWLEHGIKTYSNPHKFGRKKHVLEWLSGWWCDNHLEKYESQWEGLFHIWNGK